MTKPAHLHIFLLKLEQCCICGLNSELSWTYRTYSNLYCNKDWYNELYKKKAFNFLLQSRLQAISTTKKAMTSRTFLPTRDDNCASTLRMQSRILEAAHLMQELVHYLLFACLFNDTVLPTLSYGTFKVERHCVSNGG
jgi:hypothetical protein